MVIKNGPAKRPKILKPICSRIDTECLVFDPYPHEGGRVQWWESVCWGVVGFLASWFFGFLVSWSLGCCFFGLLVSWCLVYCFFCFEVFWLPGCLFLGFVVSKFIGLLVSKCLGFVASNFQSFKDSMIPYYQILFHVFRRILLPRPRFSRNCKTALHELSVPFFPTFSKNMIYEILRCASITFPANDFSWWLQR